jgi:DNA-binding MarR family transcriptional regulator
VKKSPDIKKSDESHQEHIGRVILLAYRAFASRSVLKLRECGYKEISLAHTSLLANLDAEGTWTSTLAERAGMTKQSMRQLALDLERKGYVKRTIDVRDKRATLITFTDTGFQLIKDVQEIKQQMQAECLSLLGQDNMQMLEEGLMKLIAHYSDKIL